MEGWSKKQSTRWTSSWVFMLQMASKWWPDDEANKDCSSDLKLLVRNWNGVKMEKWESESFLICYGCLLGLEWAENDPYICCFKSANEVLKLFYFNEAICKFANSEHMEVEVQVLHEIGLWISCKWHAKQFPIVQIV